MAEEFKTNIFLNGGWLVCIVGWSVGWLCSTEVLPKTGNQTIVKAVGGIFPWEAKSVYLIELSEV